MPSESHELAALNHRCWVEAYGPLLPDNGWQRATLPGRVSMWSTLLSRPDPCRKITVAAVGTERIGIAWARISTEPGAATGDELELYGLYVLAAQHGSGVGQALMNDVIGDEAASLWVAELNVRARAFYRRNGFTDDGGRDVHELAPGATLDVVHMRR